MRCWQCCRPLADRWLPTTNELPCHRQSTRANRPRKGKAGVKSSLKGTTRRFQRKFSSTPPFAACFADPVAPAALQFGPDFQQRPAAHGAGRSRCRRAARLGGGVCWLGCVEVFVDAFHAFSRDRGLLARYEMSCRNTLPCTAVSRKSRPA